MPIDYKNYPKNWKTEIHKAVMERAKNRCENCNVPNYAVGYRVDGIFIPTCGNLYHDSAGRGELSYKEARELVRHCNNFCDDKLIVIVLTKAHLDHNIKNNDLSNLKALCQKCHLDYDKNFHVENRRKTQNSKQGLSDLFG